MYFPLRPSDGMQCAGSDEARENTVLYAPNIEVPIGPTLFPRPPFFLAVASKSCGLFFLLPHFHHHTHNLSTRKMLSTRSLEHDDEELAYRWGQLSPWQLLRLRSLLQYCATSILAAETASPQQPSGVVAPSPNADATSTKDIHVSMIFATTQANDGATAVICGVKRLRVEMPITDVLKGFVDKSFDSLSDSCRCLKWQLRVWVEDGPIAATQEGHPLPSPSPMSQEPSKLVLEISEEAMPRAGDAAPAMPTTQEVQEGVVMGAEGGSPPPETTHDKIASSTETVAQLERWQNRCEEFLLKRNLTSPPSPLRKTPSLLRGADGTLGARGPLRCDWGSCFTTVALESSIRGGEGNDDTTTTAAAPAEPTPAAPERFSEVNLCGVSAKKALTSLWSAFRLPLEGAVMACVTACVLSSRETSGSVAAAVAAAAGGATAAPDVPLDSFTLTSAEGEVVKTIARDVISRMRRHLWPTDASLSSGSKSGSEMAALLAGFNGGSNASGQAWPTTPSSTDLAPGGGVADDHMSMFKAIIKTGRATAADTDDPQGCEPLTVVFGQPPRRKEGSRAAA